MRQVTRSKPARRDHRGEILLVREFADRFDEIGIGFAVAGHHLADARNGVERPRLVDAVEQRHVDLGEFEAEEAAAGLQHAKGLGKRRLDARHVADAEGDRVGVEGIVGEGQFLGIGLDEIDVVG